MEGDLTGTLWRDDAWLGTFPLNEVSALDYFALSPFYDPASNNEELRRQGLGAGFHRCLRCVAARAWLYTLMKQRCKACSSSQELRCACRCAPQAQ